MTDSKPPQIDQSKSIRILCVDDPAVRLYEQTGELVSAWSNANRVKVEVVVLPWEKYPYKVFSVLETGSSEFDIVMLPGYFWLPKFAANGWLTPLTDLVAKNPTAWQEYNFADILPGLREELAIDGKVYLLPSFSEVQVMYYRKDILQKSGMQQPASPVSLEKWLEIAKSVHNPEGHIYGTHFKGAATESMVEWLPFFSTAGGILPDGINEKVLRENEAILSLHKLKTFLPFCGPEVDQGDNASLFELLTNGKVGIVNHWSGQLGPIMNPKVNPYSNNYGFTSLVNSWGTVWAFGISAASQNKMAAFSCLLHLTGASADIQQGMYSGSPTRLSTFKNEKAVLDHPWYPALLLSIEKKNTFPSTVSFSAIMGNLYSMVHDVFAGKFSPEEAVQELNRKLELE